jgi:hypothetical protein
MTGPLVPPLGAAPVGHQPLAEGSPGPGQNRAGGQSISAVVVAITRQGPLIEAGGQRFLMQGAPPLPAGATLDLDLAGAGRRAMPGRLLAVAGRMLEPPVEIRLQPAPTPIGARGPAESAPRPPVAAPAGVPTGAQVEARLLGADGRPAGPPIVVRLTAGLAASDDPGGHREVAGGQPAPGPPAQSALAGSPLTAEVDGPDPSGRLLLRAAGLTLRLETAVDVPAGARLQLFLPAGFGAQPEAAASTTGGDAFGRLIHALLQRPPGAEGAGGADELRLPAADHTLAARLLRWVETLSTPDAGADVGHGDPEPDAASGALRSAVSALGQHAREPQAGGWRVLVMPLGVEDPNALRLYLRDVPPERERAARPTRGRRSPGQRAIFEVELSELGRCQLDALCRARRFDLAVRTEQPLETSLQSDIRSLFRAACALAGWAGEVEFRAAGLLSLPDPLAPGGHAYTA